MRSILLALFSGILEAPRANLGSFKLKNSNLAIGLGI
jgi:hypothetical protein